MSQYDLQDEWEYSFFIVSTNKILNVNYSLSMREKESEKHLCEETRVNMDHIEPLIVFVFKFCQFEICARIIHFNWIGKNGNFAFLTKPIYQV